MNEFEELTLTDREKETMELVAKCYGNNEIAKKLYISIAALRTRLKKLYSKFEINGSQFHKRLKLVLMWLETKK